MTFTSTANGYSGGTTIDGGVFRVDSAGELPGYDTPGTVVVNHGGTVAVAVGAGRWTASNIATLLANATFSTGSAVGIDTTCGSFTYANAITGSLGVSKLGANSLTLTGTNTYTGATTVAEGTLRAKTTGQLDTAGGVVVDSGATLALNVGGSGEWTASDVSTLLGYATFNSGSILALDTSGGDFEYDNVIAGDLGLVKLGAHTLTLPQANTYAGGTNLVAGGLMIGNNASLGSGALTLGGGTLLTDSTLTLNIPIVAADSTTSCVDADGTLTLAGSISGAGRIDCTDSDENSVLNLGGDDGGFSGELDLGPGATYFTSASAGSSLATWVLDGGVLASNVLLNVSAAPSIALGSLSGSGTLTNLVTDSTVAYQIGGADQSTQFDGVVEDGAGVVALAKTANGSLTLAGTNTYRGGTTIDGGTLVAPISGALPGYNVSVEVTVRNGGTLVVDVGTGKWTAADLSALLTDAVFNGGSVLGLDTGGGDFEYDDVIGGNLSLSKLGSGTLVLTAANTYSGDTFIRNGTLVVAGGDDRLPTGTTLTLGDAANDTSGILQLGDGTANDQTLAALINDMDYQYDAGGDRVVGGGSGVATLTLNLPAGADCEFDGILGGSGTYQNNLALTMIGPGTEDLGAVNTYGGGTTLNAGVLQVWNAEALGSGSVTVGGGVLRNLATTGYHLYYVDPDGLGGTPSDGNDGSIHSPFATLQEAYSVAQPGDTIVMRGGTYHTADLGGCIFDTGGSPGLPLTIEAAPGEHPIIDLAAMEQWQQDANGCWYTDLPTDAPLAYVEIINGWAATPVSGDPVNGGPPLALTNPDVDYYQNGQLAFDLTWYDATNHRLWFRSNEIEPITDPNTQCGVVTPGSSQGFQFFGASWIVIKGIQIQNGYIGIHIGSAGNLPADHETVEDCRITNMWDQGILMGGTYDQTSNNYIGGHYDEICNNYVDAIGGQLSNRGREWLYHDLYAVGEGFLIHDNFFGRALSGASVQLLCSNATMTSVFANNVCYGGQAFGVLVNGNDILLTGNVIISPTTIWRGSPPASAFTDDHHDGLDMDGAQNCSNIVVSGNYIEGFPRGGGLRVLAFDPADYCGYYAGVDAGGQHDRGWGIGWEIRCHLRHAARGDGFKPVGRRIGVSIEPLGADEPQL